MQHVNVTSEIIGNLGYTTAQPQSSASVTLYFVKSDSTI